MNITAIIPAGGLGKRYGASNPKQFTELNGIPIIAHTISLFQSLPEINKIVIPVHSEWYGKTQEIVAKYKFDKVKEIIIGGKVRQESVANALRTKSVQEADIILEHDAVRPLASIELIKKIISITEENGAVIPAVYPKETIKERTNSGTIVKTLDRQHHCSVQTPQGFWQELIISAYQNAAAANYFGTDSSSLVEFMGYKVTVIDGEEKNIKITTPFDTKIAELVLSEREIE